MNGDTPSNFDAWAKIVRESDEQQQALASLPLEARYRADIETYGGEESVLRAAAIRARDTSILIERARANAKEEG
uniref:hypothetical protein n=1 Tax=Halomonas sp. ZM3 TaxID=1250400 RepID=UPI001565614B|nr:hypothetical protein [Halomonas sp. ZM3]